MHYYQHNIGDYARDTSHLTVVEHGIYRMLLDWCYLNEKPITTEKAMRLARGYPTETQSVLSEFFVGSEEGWTHVRVTEEIEKFRRKAEKNRSNGVKGGRPKTQNNPVGSQPVPSGNPTVTLTKEPITNNQEPKDQEQTSLRDVAVMPTAKPPSSDDETVNGIVETWNAYADRNRGCKRTEVVTAKLRKKLLAANGEARKLVRQMGWAVKMRDFWTTYWLECESDPWMRGEVPNPNNPKWKQHLECLLDDKRFRQVMDLAIDKMRVAA